MAVPRFLTASNRARSNATFNSLATFCRLNCWFGAAKFITAMDAMIAMMTKTMTSSTRLRPLSSDQFVRLPQLTLFTAYLCRQLEHRAIDRRYNKTDKDTHRHDRKILKPKEDAFKL